MRLLKLLSLVCVLALSLSTEARKKKVPTVTKMSGVVERCHDGDTCHVMVAGKRIKVRFAGIDTPEIKQKDGIRARNFTEFLIKGKTVDLDCDGTSFDRITCTVYQAGVNINAEIVRKGWAFDSKRYSKGKYASSEQEAKAGKIGIWKDDQLSSPFCFRSPKAKQCLRDKAYMP